jgi:hypothetical protein
LMQSDVWHYIFISCIHERMHGIPVLLLLSARW